MNESYLRDKGFVQQPDGSWSKPKRDPVRPVEASQPEQASTQALACRPPKHPKRKGRVAIVISLIAAVHRELDSDNLAGACKPLRDAIAETIGIDDGDRRIRWQYGQIETRGETGVIVNIQAL